MSFGTLGGHDVQNLQKSIQTYAELTKFDSDMCSSPIVPTKSLGGGDQNFQQGPIFSRTKIFVTTFCESKMMPRIVRSRIVCIPINFTA